MTTIHLTDAQRDTFPVIVIGGEEMADWHGEGGFEWVAPEDWRILTEPCDTCGGEGWIKRHGGIEGVPYRDNCPNPDCVGGRRVVTLTATCPHDDGDISTTGGLCDVCGSTEAGVVTLGRYTIPALLPVIDPHVTDWMEREHVSVYSTGQVLYIADGSDPEYGTKSGPIALAPTPQPGQFIARPEPVP